MTDPIERAEARPMTHTREGEAERPDQRKGCKRCGGRGFIVLRALGSGKIKDFDCPDCAALTPTPRGGEPK
jgi:hypothetical protein